ncbi:MAG: hypothetical protein NTZ84_01440 [Candidatus Nealsonbacteria bacterium]|nr:hypothetical protein [Candidatus Nealsonbacteria bacterium]
MENNLKIAVSGAANLKNCPKETIRLAEEVGREIIRQGCVLITGATTGVPYYSAKAAKAAGGISIGFSPAASKLSHVRAYKLPTDVFDVIVYTGFDYAGRNLLMTRASDGIIVIYGRMGTLNEFTIAFEDEKPTAVLEGSGGTADMIKNLLKMTHKNKKQIIYEKDPKKLVAKLIQVIKKGRAHKKRTLKNAKK